MQIKISYLSRNIKPTPLFINFVNEKIAKLQKILEKHFDEAVLELELFKLKELKSDKGTIKVKIILDLKRKKLLSVEAESRSLTVATNKAFKELTRQLEKYIV
ncbi:MAG: hypothetical protein KatS3mg097_384 [Candidatus Parcubacteria bacterium]|nr:MAG: hypothetical protein KatS3mg097_384 [Candidatus Parcubacteria bacterium]